jgi:PAS domain S-box-containing protein
MAHDDEARRAQEAAWPDMFANLQSAYAELTNAQFELERRASEIAETRDLVQQIVTSMSEALFLTDRAGRVIRANPAAANLLGCTEDAILGRPLSAVCGTEAIPATPWKLMEVAQGDKLARVDVDIQTARNETVPVSFALTLMHDKQDKITGVLAVARDMREQRELINNLVAARTRFQELLEFAPDAIVLANQEGRIVLVNSQTERLFGYHREALLGQSVEMLVPERYRNDASGAGESLSAPASAAQPTAPSGTAPLQPTNAPVPAPTEVLTPAEIVSLEGQPVPVPLADLDPIDTEPAVLTARNADERAQQIEFSVVDSQGREFPVEITQRPIVTEDGLLLMSVIRDISARKRIEHELHLSEGRYRALAETAQDVILTLDEHWTILFANPATLTVFGHPSETLIGRSAESLMPQATLAFTMTRVEYPQAKGLRVEAVEKRKDDTPVRLEITTSQFEQEGRQLFTWFIRDITERHRIQQQLAETETLYRNIANSAAEVIVTIDAAGQIQFANPAVQRVFGYEPAALSGQNLARLLPGIWQRPDDLSASGPLQLSLKATESIGLHADGHEIQLEISFSEFDRDGQQFYTTILHDITERKEIEQRLLDSEQRYRSVIESATEMIVTVNDDGVIEFTNAASARLFGYESESLAGRNLSELIPTYPGYVEKAKAQREHEIATSAPVVAAMAWNDENVPGLRADGTEVLLDFSFNEFTRNNQRYFTGILRDITARKQAEAALRLNQRALEASAFPILIADAQAPDLPLTYVNPAFERVTGYTAAEAVGKNCRFLQGSDREQPALDELRTALKEARACTVTLRNYRKDGTLFYNELTVSPVFDEAGKLTHFVGFEHDVTERIKADEALLQANALQAAIVNYAATAIIATDPFGVIVSFNPMAERMLGYTAAELIGRQNLTAFYDSTEITERAKTLTIELGEEVPPGFPVFAINSQKNLPNEHEWTALRKDGTRLPVSLSVTALRDGEGAITGYLGIASDITARKQAEARMERQAALRLSVTNALSETGDSLLQMLQRCCDTLVVQQEAALVRVWLMDEAHDTLKLQASAGLTEKTEDAQAALPLTHQPLGEIAQTRQAYLTNDNPVAPLGEDGEVLPAFVGAPLLAGEKTLGVVGLYSRHALDPDALNALSSVADALVLAIERKRAEQERVRAQQREAARNNHHTALRFEVSNALNDADATLRQILQRCVESVVEHLDAALARIWLASNDTDTLSLQATAGPLASTLHSQQTVAFGDSEIGAIAHSRRPHLTNDVANDERILDREWAQREKLNSFAGYPLVAADNRLIGVLGMFSRQRLEQETLHALASVATTLVLGIERKRAEEERIALLEREQHARHEAEEASRLKDDFLAMISHELRAPLTAILGWAQMLRSGSLDRAAAERALLTIERNAKSQAHLVGDLLDASRLATGKLRLEKRPIELMQLIESAIDAVRPSVEAKNLRLQIVMEPWVGPFEGDAERMKQIVWNLLSNAVKFTPSGGLIEIRLERLENKALLIISDTGQGIEPEFLPYVFDRFRQADSSTKRQQGGLGLGLAIVKHLVEMHGGAIYAYSGGKGKGADFMITLPLGDAAETKDPDIWQPSAEAEAQKASGSLRGVRVLVVDDERDTREILSVMLSRFGTEVRMAGSVAEGFELFKQWRPDLMVSDIGMPIEDGYVMIGKVRALSAEEGGQTPVVALTAFASSQDRAKAMESGFNVHLSKPVEPVELARVVARTLGRSEEGIEL